jgi:hypothetical protein
MSAGGDKRDETRTASQTFPAASSTLAARRTHAPAIRRIAGALDSCRVGPPVPGFRSLRSTAAVPGAFLPEALQGADFLKPMKEMEMSKVFVYAFAALFAVASVDAAAAKPAAGEQRVSTPQKGKKALKKTERRVKKKVKNPDEPK